MPRLLYHSVLAALVCTACSDAPTGSVGADVGLFPSDSAVSSSTPDAAPSVEQACASATYEAELLGKGVDLIFVVDNSGSMSEEARQVERNINDNFARIIGQSGLDYRIIMITSHRVFGDSQVSTSICIGPPLSPADCDAGAPAPELTERFKHYDVPIGSEDSFHKALSSFDTSDLRGLARDGWRQWLRPDALKVFIEITDHTALYPDDGDILDPETNRQTAAAFDRALREKDERQFGVRGTRNYVWHSIVGVAEKDDVDAPYTADEPHVEEACSTATGSGLSFQFLSILTGGLRYPVCQTTDYGGIFSAIADDTIERSGIPCSVLPPVGDQGQPADLDSLEVRASAAGGEERDLQRVPDAEGCTSGGDYYLAEGLVVLCPSLCAQLRDEGEVDALELHAPCSEVPCQSQDSAETCDDGVDNNCDGFIDRGDPQCIL